MIGYLTTGTNDLSRAAKSYDALLATIGIQRLWHHRDMAAWGSSRSKTALCVTRPFGRQAANVGNGVITAFKVDCASQVDAFYAKGIELGLKNEGSIGLQRKHGVYAGNIWGLNGSKLKAKALHRADPL